MIDRDAVEQLFASYAWALDTRDVAGLEEVYAEDASFSFGDTTVEGRAAVLEFVAATIARVEGTRRHVITNLQLRDGEATAYLIRYVVRDGTLYTESTGVYRFRVVETDAGLRFGRCRLDLDLPLPHLREESA